MLFGNILRICDVKKPLCFLPFFLAACASAPQQSSDNLISPEFKAPAPGALIVLLPPQAEGAELKEGVDSLLVQLHRQLKAAGYKVAGIARSNYETIWAQEVDAVGGVYDTVTGKRRHDAYFQAHAHLVQRVGDDMQAALVIEPRLLLRKATLSGATVQWDGQQRRVLMSNSAGREYRSDGTTVAMSVNLNVFAASGEPVAMTYGGASLVYSVNIQAAKHEVRSDIFANDKELAQGVALSLSPLFKPSAQ